MQVFLGTGLGTLSTTVQSSEEQASHTKPLGSVHKSLVQHYAALSHETATPNQNIMDMGLSRAKPRVTCQAVFSSPISFLFF